MNSRSDRPPERGRCISSHVGARFFSEPSLTIYERRNRILAPVQVTARSLEAAGEREGIMAWDPTLPLNAIAHRPSIA